MSDDHWIGDEDSKAFAMMIGRINFHENLIQNSTPLEMQEKILDAIYLNIQSCSSRIRLQPDKTKAEMDIQALFSEYEKLKHPKSSEFHWDMSIYNTRTNSFDSNEEMENESYYSENESSSANEINCGRNIGKPLTVGSQKSAPQSIVYNIGDMLILLTGFI
jgi:hypothetical protein